MRFGQSLADELDATMSERPLPEDAVTSLTNWLADPARGNRYANGTGPHTDGWTGNREPGRRRDRGQGREPHGELGRSLRGLPGMGLRPDGLRPDPHPPRTRPARRRSRHRGSRVPARRESPTESGAPATELVTVTTSTSAGCTPPTPNWPPRRRTGPRPHRLCRASGRSEGELSCLFGQRKVLVVEPVRVDGGAVEVGTHGQDSLVALRIDDVQPDDQLWSGGVRRRYNDCVERVHQPRLRTFGENVHDARWATFRSSSSYSNQGISSMTQHYGRPTDCPVSAGHG